MQPKDSRFGAVTDTARPPSESRKHVWPTTAILAIIKNQPNFTPFNNFDPLGSIYFQAGGGGGGGLLRPIGADTATFLGLRQNN